jgi:Protein  of unknown function (DUF3018)
MTSAANTAKTSAERMRDHRRRMRAKGYVQKTIWVPDMRNAQVRERYARAAETLASLGLSDDDKAWLAHSEATLNQLWAEEDNDREPR